MGPSGERRSFVRAPGAAWAVVGARIRPGHTVVVIDLSHGGALVDAALRLLPGASVDLQIESVLGRTVHGGRVVRSAVAELSASVVRYRAAIAFDRWPQPLHEPAGYVLPEGESIAQGALRVGLTREGQ
jgi:hypothetical protein